MFKTFYLTLSFSRLIKSSPSSNPTPITTSSSPLTTPTSPIPSPSIPPTQPQTIRLSKLVSQQSVCSRRQAQKLISLGLIRINGTRVYANTLVPVSHTLKVFTPRGVRKEIPVIKLWMINKPRGCICTETDPEKRPTIYQLLPPSFKSLGHIMSIGRLDYNTEGLLLLTNNNDLKQILESPSTNLPRVYRVKVHGRVTESKLQSMRKGCTINGIHYQPFKVTQSRQLSTNVWLYIEIKQGKNREIRKVLQKHDLQVNKLIRVEYGPYKLGILGLREIKELEIEGRWKRELEKRMVGEVTGGKGCLIEVEMRPEAIEMARGEIEREKLSGGKEQRGRDKELEKWSEEQEKTKKIE